jgi:DNA-directed RNA polymerase specialized sigma24 family protein
MNKTDTRKLDAWARLREVRVAATDHTAEYEAAILHAREVGWSFAQIGSALGISAQSVHRYVHRRTERGETTK